MDSLTLNVYVTSQIQFKVDFDLTYVDSQFPMSPSPRKQRKLRINPG